MVKEEKESLSLGNVHFYRSYSSKQKSVSGMVRMMAIFLIGWEAVLSLIL